MDRFLADDLWPTIQQLGEKALRKRAAVAYVTSDKYLKFGKGDELITDASYAAIRCGATKAKVLAEAVAREASVYSVSGLHAKVILLDNVAIVGSGNLSKNSAESLIEAAWIGESPGLVGGAVAFLEQLKAIADQVDQQFLDRIAKIEVQKTSPPPKRVAKKKIQVPKARIWLIGPYPEDREHPEDDDAVERGKADAKKQVQHSGSEVDWIRWTGRSKFRKEVQVGDTVITVWSPARRMRPTRAYKHTRVLKFDRNDERTLVFVEQAHDEEETALPWGKFKKLLKRVGFMENVGPDSAREVPAAVAEALYQLWKD